MHGVVASLIPFITESLVSLLARFVHRFASALRLPAWLDGLAAGALGDEALPQRSLPTAARHVRG
jgi:hypothetical protein